MVRIAVPVFIETKLESIDKNGGHHDIAVLVSDLDQLQMSIVEVAHCRHQADTMAFGALDGQRIAQPLDGMKSIHGRKYLKGGNEP